MAAQPSFLLFGNFAKPAKKPIAFSVLAMSAAV
jgi:hypothetical protein